MFDIGWTEILVIAIVAIVVVPSKDLPKLLRTVGQMVGKGRRMAGDFQRQFNAALREAEREADLMDTKSELEGLKKLNPLADIRKSLDPIRNPVEAIKRELTGPTPAAVAGSAAAATVPAADAAATPAEPAKAGHAAEVPGTEPAPLPRAVDVPAPSVMPPPVAFAPPAQPSATSETKTNADGGKS